MTHEFFNINRNIDICSIRVGHRREEKCGSKKDNISQYGMVKSILTFALLFLIPNLSARISDVLADKVSNRTKNVIILYFFVEPLQ